MYKQDEIKITRKASPKEIGVEARIRARLELDQVKQVVGIMDGALQKVLDIAEAAKEYKHSERRKNMAAENSDIKRTVQTEDVREYIELLKGLTRDEKNQVKGIMIGMQETRKLFAAVTA